MNTKVWRLAWPLIISSISVPLLGVVDTAIMGRMPDPAYLGAVAVGALIFDFVYWAFGFLRMGTTGFTAQAFGAGDHHALQLALVRPLLMGTVIGAALWALQWPIGTVALRLLDPGPELLPLTTAYFDVRIWAAPMVLANYAMLGWLIGLQRPKLALVTQLVANGLNIGFDLLFVVGLGWGVEGVALGSVIAQCGGLVSGVLLARRVFGQRQVGWSAVWESQALWALWSVNRDIFIRTLGLMTAFAWFTAQGAAQGKIILAANAVLFNFQLIMSYALDGFAHAAEVLVGESLAQKDPARLRTVVRATLRASVVIALVFMGIWAVFGPVLIDGLTDLVAVRITAREYLPWTIALPIVAVWCFQMDGICIGAMHTQAMRNGMLVSLVGFVLSGWILMAYWGNHGLWAAFTFFLALRGLTLWPTLRRLQR